MRKSKELLTIRFLPTKCKIWGVIIIAVSIVPAVIFHVRDVQLSSNGRDMLKAVTFGMFTLGLSLIAWAKDKIEDELTILIRLKAMAYTFGFAVFYAISQPFANALVFGSGTQMSSYQLVLTMLIAYLVMYYTQKWRR